MITEDQLDFITGKVKESSISSKEVQDDLIDHFYCLIEEDMDQGVSFEVAYQKAFQQTTPNGFDEIQEEVFFVLNFNKITNMKRITYLTGFISSLGLTLSVVFKSLHLPGASILLFGSIMVTAFVFAPLLLVSHLKTSGTYSPSEKMKWIVGAAGFMMLALGSILNMLHLEGSGAVLISGGFLFGFGFLPFLFYTLYKRSIEAV